MKTTYSTVIFCSSSFKWADNSAGTCKKSELITTRALGNKHMAGEYKGVFIKSIKTGVVKYFEPVHDEDGYDGEFMIYKNDNIFIQIWNY